MRNESENEYTNPSKKKYETAASLCSEKNSNYYGSDICASDSGRKIAISDLDESEGCLSKDGSLFILVVPGMYMDGGNHVFRYFTAQNILQEAEKVNEEKGQEWFDPPFEFRNRVGDIVKMFGMNGDAGCGLKSDYEYNFVKNEVKVVKTCSSCDDEKWDCQMFK